jgi:hypothetical protein
MSERATRGERDTASRAKRTWNPWREHAAAIAARIEAGTPMEPACVLEGVSIETVRDAIDRADPDADVIVRARAALEARLVTQAVELASAGTPVASSAGWLLERIAPKRWHLPSKVEVSGPEGGPTQAEVRITLADAVAGARGDGER